MKRLVLLVGIPGSGKSTLAQHLIERGYVCFNADEIRKEVLGDASDQSQSDKVFDVFFQQLEESMKRGDDIVIDNTNINTRHRSPILQRAVQAGYQDIQLWILDVPLQVCIERNHARGRAVPDDVVTNYYNTLNGHGKPRRHEGKLILVRPGPKDFEYKFFQMK